MANIQQQFIAHQALVNQVTSRIKRFEAALQAFNDLPPLPTDIGQIIVQLRNIDSELFRLGDDDPSRKRKAELTQEKARLAVDLERVQAGDSVKRIKTRLDRIANDMAGPGDDDPSQVHKAELGKEREVLTVSLKEAEKRQEELSTLSGSHGRRKIAQGALESAKREFLNLTGTRFGE